MEGNTSGSQTQMEYGARWNRTYVRSPLYLVGHRIGLSMTSMESSKLCSASITSVLNRFLRQRPDCCHRHLLRSRLDISEDRVVITRFWSTASPAQLRTVLSSPPCADPTTAQVSDSLRISFGCPKRTSLCAGEALDQTRTPMRCLDVSAHHRGVPGPICPGRFIATA
jgi:hypothetical protein